MLCDVSPLILAVVLQEIAGVEFVAYLIIPHVMHIVCV